MLNNLLLLFYLFVSSDSAGARRRYIMTSIFVVELLLIACSAVIGFPGYENFAGMRPPIFHMFGVTIDTAMVLCIAIPVVISVFAASLATVAAATWILKSGSYDKQGTVTIKSPQGLVNETNKEYLTKLTRISKSEIALLVIALLLLIPLDTARNVVGASVLSTKASNTVMTDSDSLQTAIAGSSIDVDRFDADRKFYQDVMEDKSSPYTRTDNNGNPYIVWDCYYMSNGVRKKHWSDCDAVGEAHEEYIRASQNLALAEGNYQRAVALQQGIDTTIFGMGEAAKTINNNFLLYTIVAVYFLVLVFSGLEAVFTIRLKLEDPEHLRSGKSTMLSNILGAFVTRGGNFWSHTARTFSEAKSNVQSSRQAGGPKVAKTTPPPRHGSSGPSGPMGGSSRNPFSSLGGSPVLGGVPEEDDNDSSGVPRTLPRIVDLFLEYYVMSTTTGSNPANSKHQMSARGFAIWLRKIKDEQGPAKTILKPGNWEYLMGDPKVKVLK